MSSALSEAQREAVQEMVDNLLEEVKRGVQEYQMEQFAEEVAVTTQKVLGKLDDSGVETGRANVDIGGIARDCVIEEMVRSGPSTGRTVDIPIAGRINQEADSYTEITLPENSDPPTKTVEVPIEGGDVEDPDTMEREVPDPEPIDFDAGEKVLNEAGRLNVEQNAKEDEEYDPEDAPVAGRRCSEYGDVTVDKQSMSDPAMEDEDDTDEDLPWYQ